MENSFEEDRGFVSPLTNHQPKNLDKLLKSPMIHPTIKSANGGKSINDFNTMFVDNSDQNSFIASINYDDHMTQRILNKRSNRSSNRKLLDGPSTEGITDLHELGSKQEKDIVLTNNQYLKEQQKRKFHMKLASFNDAMRVPKIKNDLQSGPNDKLNIEQQDMADKYN